MDYNEKVQTLKQFERMVQSRVDKLNQTHFLSREDEEELANDVRMKIWLSLDRYDPAKASLSTWVYKAINLRGATFLFHYFKDTVKTADHNSIDFTSLAAASIRDNEEGYEIAYDDKDIVDRLSFTMIIDSIPQPDRRSMMFRWCSGWTMQEIAEEDGCSKQNVQQIIAATRKWLRENIR